MLRVLVLLVLVVANTAWGQVAALEVTRSQLDAAVENISASLPEDDPQRIALLELYSETQAALLNIKQYQDARDGFALARANAATEAQSILEALVEAQAASAQHEKVISVAPLQELEQMMQLDKAELEAEKAQRAGIRVAIDALPGRPAVIRARISELVGLLAELESQLGLMNKESASGGEDEARHWLALAQHTSAAAERESLNEELLSQPMRLDLFKAQLDQVSYDISVLADKLQAMEDRASILRQGEAADARAEAELVLAGTQGKHELVQQLADRNAELTASFGERSTAIEDVRQREAVNKSAAELLETDLSSIERKLEILGMSPVVGEILREQQAQLPGRGQARRKLSAMSAEIRKSSLRQVELEDERRRLRDRPEYIARLVQGLSEPTVVLIAADLDELAGTRRDLMRQAVDLENTYAQALGDLDFTLRRYSDVAVHYREFISERLLWLPSREAFTLFRGAAFREHMKAIFEPARWLRVMKELPSETVRQPGVALLLLLLFALVYYNPRLIRGLAVTGKQVGYVRDDQFSSTMHALGLTAVLAVKWPLLMLIFAWLFEMQEAESELATALYIASLRTSAYFFGLELMRMALLPSGLVDTHFRWPTRRTSSLYRRVVRLEQTFLPAAFVVGLSISLFPREVGGPMGAAGVIVVLYSIAHFFRLLPPFVQVKMGSMFSGSASGKTSFIGKLVKVLLYWVPVAAIVAVFFGYTYTAIEFALLLVETVVLASAALMFHELGLRWLRLTRRRLAFKVRQDHMAKDSEEEGEASPEEELLENDPDLLNDEGTKLLNVLTLLLGALGLALIWAEVFPALRILDSVELWSQAGVVDGREVPVPVTLADLFSAVAIAFVGWVALQRIPSLLEILLRQRANVRPASAYAITRVFQYVATTLLVVFILGALGGSWSSMQWAVAALSLGIGFGLQEIVANFISGLIILFEQPIRLGDTITVGEISGKVTKIQMRATTVRDFDRRELLVPNKEFITTQLLNWSLSDQVTRRLLQVGVAYGTDMDKAMAIVRDAALHHPLVLVDPESMITFDEFGDNSLLISLRFFLDQLEQRLTVASELRLEINRRFNEEGIVVAFPQRDIHLDTSDPLEIRMLASGADGEVDGVVPA